MTTETPSILIDWGIRPDNRPPPQFMGAAGFSFSGCPWNRPRDHGGITALSEIRDSRIHRVTFKTFEEYCQKRWNFSRVRAHQMIEAAQTASVLTVVNGPTTERQARELAKTPVEKHEEVMERAHEIAKEGRERLTGWAGDSPDYVIIPRDHWPHPEKGEGLNPLRIKAFDWLREEDLNL